MALNIDDLQRLRNAVRAGWDFTHCHEIDFQSVFTELLDNALGQPNLAQQVYDVYPHADDLGYLLNELEEDCVVPDKLMASLREFQTDLDEAYTKAGDLIDSAN